MGLYDINEGDFRGYTPLAWAAHNGHDEMVEMLLGREEVDPDKQDNDGRTPLSHAAGRGYEGVVKLLLRREDVNPNRPDNCDQTPLMFATKLGHRGVVALLQACEAVTHCPFKRRRPDDETATTDEQRNVETKRRQLNRNAKN